MKVRDILDQLDETVKQKKPALMVDSEDTDFNMKYRHSRKLPLLFYGMFIHEIKNHMDEIMDLEVSDIQKEDNLSRFYVIGLKRMFVKIQYGGKDEQRNV